VSWRAVIPVYRVAFAILTLVAIIVQLLASLKTPHYNPVNFFSYFTIDSNLFAAVVLLYAGAAGWTAAPRLDGVRGAAVVYMTVTGVVYALLLRNTDVDTAIPWVNSVVHEVMPLVMLADWVIDPPEATITIGQAVLWLAFPLVWIIYTMTRGALAGWYPYPFLDPGHGGYGTVAIYVVGILIFMVAVCAAIAWLGRLRLFAISRK
jgi:hypothetical protein